MIKGGNRLSKEQRWMFNRTTVMESPVLVGNNTGAGCTSLPVRWPRFRCLSPAAVQLSKDSVYRAIQRSDHHGVVQYENHQVVTSYLSLHHSTVCCRCSTSQLRCDFWPTDAGLLTAFYFKQGCRRPDFWLTLLAILSGWFSAWFAMGLWVLVILRAVGLGRWPWLVAMPSLAVSWMVSGLLYWNLSNFMQNAFGLAVGFALYKAFPEFEKDSHSEIRRWKWT